MQIDTHNRNYDINNDTVGYKEWFIPKQFTGNNMTDLHSGMSPLIECPCTDRISKSKNEIPIYATNGTCDKDKVITSKQDCRKAVNDAGISFENVQTINDPTKPKGCIIRPITSGTATTFKVYFNAVTKSSATTCGGGKKGVPVALAGHANLGNLTNLKLSHNGFSPGKNVTITLSGPNGVWFGVGFDAKQMADEPYALILLIFSTESCCGRKSMFPIMESTTSRDR